MLEVQDNKIILSRSRCSKKINVYISFMNYVIITSRIIMLISFENIFILWMMRQIDFIYYTTEARYQIEL